MALLNAVIDLSHHNDVSSFHEVKAAGIMGVFHKATEGLGYRDPEYASRKVRALSVDLFWGAYHFATKGKAIRQADHFLATVDPKELDLLVLDWEPNPRTGDMTLTEAEVFVAYLKSKTGKYPVLYSGESFLRSQLGDRETVLSNCPLWIAKYSSAIPRIPPAFSKFTLWQYTDGANGPEPHQVPGVGRCDRNKFNGTEAELREFWT